MNLKQMILPLIILFVTTTTYAEPSDIDVQVLVQSLYTAARWETCHVPVLGQSDKYLFPVVREGLAGIIPLHSIIAVDLDSVTVVIGMEIFLANVDKNAIGSFQVIDMHDNSEKLKLVQVVTFNKQQKRFVQRVPDYPLMDSSWVCFGDICSTPALSDIIYHGNVAGIGKIIQIINTIGFDSFSAWYGYTEQEGFYKLVGSTRVGDFAGESGCEISIRQVADIQIMIPQILTIRTCGTGCDDVCRQMDLPSGVDTIICTIRKYYR
jgi:hypothetical protein